ncbi:MAG TPA: DUF6702 family protein [Ohtaekwangia sp.]|nr:DUF6702 family protein [Ohtaekwangia sp.]
MILTHWFFTFLFSVGLTGLHPIHVSVTDIEFDEKDKALEIMMRVFTDDLETTMRKHENKPDLDILNPKGTTLDKLMADYMRSNFEVTLDGKVQKLNYLGNERDGDVFVFYIEVSNIKKWNQINVLNTILMETFDDQSNLVHVTVRGKIKSMRLTENNPSDKLSFDLK